MNDIAITEAFQLPQIKGQSDQPDLRPRMVQRWLANLPVANLGTMSGSFYEALKALNQRQLKTSERLAFLEAVRPNLRATIEGLRAHYSPKQFPAPAKSRRVSEFSLALLREMALGYDLIVQAATRGGPRVGKRQLILAMQRSVHCHGVLLMECYYLYQPAPEGLWKRLHELYLMALAQGLQDVAVADDALRYGKRTSVSQSYKQILLLAAAAPQRLRYQELDDLFAALEVWAALAALAPLPITVDADSGFLVHLDRDLPPQPLLRQPIRTRQTYLLDCRQPLASFNTPPIRQGRWSRLLRGKAATAPPSVLQDQLIDIFATDHRRRFPRRAMSQPVQALVGLTQISRTLAQQKGVPLETDAKSANAVAVTIHSDDARWEYDEKRGWHVVQDRSKKAKKEEIEDLLPESKQGLAGDQPQQDWQALDTSAGGYRLLLYSKQATLARLGEVIAIQEQGKTYQASWQIGITRWLRHIPFKGLELGVELIAVNPIPALIKPELAAGREAKAVHALLLPQMAALNQPMRILTPPLPYISGIRAAIIDGGSDYNILLTRELDASGSFKSFEFAPIARKEEEEDIVREDFQAVYSNI
jgi:hypothetical protein